MAWLQAPVIKAAILLLVSRMEDSWQDGESSSDVGPRYLQLSGVAQAAPLQPGDVLDELQKEHPKGSELLGERGITAWLCAGPQGWTGAASPLPGPCPRDYPAGQETGRLETSEVGPSQ